MRVNKVILLLIFLFHTNLQAEEADYSAKFQDAVKVYWEFNRPSPKDLSKEWLPELFKQLEFPDSPNPSYISDVKVSLILLNELISRNLVDSRQELLVLIKVAEIPFNTILNQHSQIEESVLFSFRNPIFIPMAKQLFSGKSERGKSIGGAFLKMMRDSGASDEELDVKYQPIVDKYLNQMKSTDIYLPFNSPEEFITCLVEQIKNISILDDSSRKVIDWTIEMALDIFKRESDEFDRKWERMYLTALLNLPFSDDSSSENIKLMIMKKFFSLSRAKILHN